MARVNVWVLFRFQSIELEGPVVWRNEENRLEKFSSLGGPYLVQKNIRQCNKKSPFVDQLSTQKLTVDELNTFLPF